MPPSEIRDLVKNGESISGLTFDDEAVSTITAKSLGFPYSATLLSQRSALTAIDGGRVVVGAQDVEEAVGEVIEEIAEGRHEPTPTHGQPENDLVRSRTE